MAAAHSGDAGAGAVAAAAAPVAAAGAAAGPEMTDTKAAALVSVISGMSDTHWSPTGGGSPNCKRKDEVQHRPDQRENDDQAKHGDYKKLKQEGKLFLYRYYQNKKNFLLNFDYYLGN